MTSPDPNSTVASPPSSLGLRAISGQPVRVASWPTEKPLFVLVLLVSLGLWAALAISIIGLVYVALIGLFLFFVHLAFVTHLRGSAVRLGPGQFPELHARVQELARAAGLEREPEAYLLESGGSLNALATKFFRGRMIVLFSDLLDACGDDLAARDMVIGHEVGHLRRRPPRPPPADRSRPAHAVPRRRLLARLRAHLRPLGCGPVRRPGRRGARPRHPRRRRHPREAA